MILQDAAAPVLPSARSARDAEELAGAARGFESIFVQTLLKSMRSGLPKSGFLDGGRGGEVFTGLLDRQFGDAAASRGGGLGLARMILAQVAKQRGEPPGGTLDLRVP